MPPQNTTSDPVHTAAALMRGVSGAGGNIFRVCVVGLYLAPSPRDFPDGVAIPPQTINCVLIPTIDGYKRAASGERGTVDQRPAFRSAVVSALVVVGATATSLTVVGTLAFAAFGRLLPPEQPLRLIAIAARATPTAPRRPTTTQV